MNNLYFSFILTLIFSCITKVSFTQIPNTFEIHKVDSLVNSSSHYKKDLDIKESFYLKVFENELKTVIPFRNVNDVFTNPQLKVKKFIVTDKTDRIIILEVYDLVKDDSEKSEINYINILSSYLGFQPLKDLNRFLIIEKNMNDHVISSRIYNKKASENAKWNEAITQAVLISGER